jgi:hypothetical protein
MTHQLETLDALGRQAGHLTRFFRRINMFYRFEIEISTHARERMFERDIREEEVFAVLERGRRTPRRDSVRVQIRESDLGANARPRLLNLVGIVVVLTLDEQVVKTVIRTEERRYSRRVLRHLEADGPRFKLGDLLGHALAICIAGIDEES